MKKYGPFALNPENYTLVMSYIVFLSEFRAYANSYGAENLKEAEKLLSNVRDAFSGMASGDTDALEFGCYAALSRLAYGKVD